MDGNKDEALKCLDMGREAFESGDAIRALKFVTKARRLDPLLPVDDLLAAIESGTIKNESFPSTQSKPPNSSSLRHRFEPGGTSSVTSSVGYTEEQASIVRQVKCKKDYYDILGLQKTCTVEDVRKAYRKLSLKVHPDKNKAPGSEEAFKSVSKAFQCLSDEERRKGYDLVGSEEPVNARQSTRYRANGVNGFYEADIDPQEIFRNFFGGMAPATFATFNFGTGVPRRMDDHRSGSSRIRMLVQLLPVLLIILLNFLPSSDPVYSLSRKYPYEYRYVTQRGVNYYVKENFEHKYLPETKERSSLENEVDGYYYKVLESNCRLEMQRFHFGYVRDTPHCDMLKQFQTVA